MPVSPVFRAIGGIGMTPLVSICCTTYNHKQYLAQAIDSFLAQITDFETEILVHDDLSTDGTTEILKEYAAKYPDRIFPLYETENQYSKGIPISETFNFPRARGKYIAMCEGDDYWCDPNKLQKQIDAMEADPGCTFSFTNATIHDVSGEKPDRPFLPYYESEQAFFAGHDAVYSLSDIARLSFIPTASFVFRTDALRSLPESFLARRCDHGDLRMKLYLTAAGHARYINIAGSVYRENVAGSAFQVWKSEDRAKLFARCESVVGMVSDVDAYSKGTAHEALEEIRHHYLTVMAHNAPDLNTLKNGELGEVFRSLPPSEQLRCSMKLILPERVSEAVSAVLKGR